MPIQRAVRLDRLPPYLFLEIDRKKREAIQAGRDVIDFGVGDPDKPTPDFIIQRMSEAIRDPANHRYPHDAGVPAMKATIAAWFERRFGVALDGAREILVLIGSKEGLGHLPLAVVNPGDVALVPQPGYPVYEAASLFAGGEPVVMPLTEERGFLPDLEAIPTATLDRASLMFVNYPNNPTGAVADLGFFERCVQLARRHRFVICSDAAYSEMYYDAGDKPHSILEVPGAKDVTVEFHSLSKTFNMTGWRIGFAVGNADVLAALARIKANMDSGAFNAIQHSAVAAMKNIDGPEVAAIRARYLDRRDRLVPGLNRLGFEVRSPRATFYVWARCPAGRDSMSTAARLLDEASVVSVPGIGFGKAGEGYVRFALTVDAERISQALDRMAAIRW